MMDNVSKFNLVLLASLGFLVACAETLETDAQGIGSGNGVVLLETYETFGELQRDALSLIASSNFSEYFEAPTSGTATLNGTLGLEFIPQLNEAKIDGEYFVGNVTVNIGFSSNSFTLYADGFSPVSDSGKLENEATKGTVFGSGNIQRGDGSTSFYVEISSNELGDDDYYFSGVGVSGTLLRSSSDRLVAVGELSDVAGSSKDEALYIDGTIIAISN